MISTHTINTGITNRSISPDFKIDDYNNSLTPYGEITFWIEFDDTSNTYDVISHKSKLIYNSTGIYYEYPDVENWGSTNLLNSSNVYVYALVILGLVYTFKMRRLSWDNHGIVLN